MRRANKEIIQHAEIEDIIRKSTVCHLAISQDDIPYIVPLSFGFDGSNLFFHTATEGRKIDFWTKNPVVCFEFETDIKTIPDEKSACKWTTTFKSVIGYGRISELVEFEEKINALNKIMEQYSGKKWDFEHQNIKNVKLWKVQITELKGKSSN